MPNQVHSTADLMRAAADALIKRDTVEISALMMISREWMQPQHETNAQQHLLEAIMEAACLLESEDSDLTPTDEPY